MSHLASPLPQPHLLRILFRKEIYLTFPGLLVAIENQIGKAIKGVLLKTYPENANLWLSRKPRTRETQTTECL